MSVLVILAILHHQSAIMVKDGVMSCGLPPLPPLNCDVGDCVCDQNGNNCQWQFVCN
jgi:hypothetical protein